MPDLGSACGGRFNHSWHVRKFGGIGCGRCGERRNMFCMVNGKPTPHSHETQTQVSEPQRRNGE